MRFPYRNEPYARGYTLIEMLVVMVILGVLAAVGMNMLGGGRQAPAVRGTLNTLMGALSEAKSMARSTGTQVYLQTSGSGVDDIAIRYGADDGAGGISATQTNGIYTQAGDGRNVNAYAVIDINGAQYASTAPSPALSSALLTALTGSGSLPPPLFKGTTNRTYYFDGAGRINQSAFIAVHGGRSGSVDKSGPVGIIILSPTSGIYGYYKTSASNNSEAWKPI